MSNDLPIEEMYPEDMPVEEASSLLPVEYLTPIQQNDNAVKVASMKYMMEGFDPFEAWTATLTANDVPLALEQQNYLQRTEEKESIAIAYGDAVHNSSDNTYVQETTDIATQMVVELNQEDNTLKGKHLPYIRAISSELATPEAIEQEAQLQVFRDEIAKLSDDIGWFEGLQDFLVGFVPGNILKDALDLEEGMEANAQQVLEKMIINFKAGDVERQKELFPLYKQFLFDNLEETQAVRALSEMLDPSQDATIPSDFNAFWQIFDTADLLLSSYAVGSGLFRLMKNTNAIRTAKRAGNEELASVINDMVLSDKTGDAAKTVGETRADAMDNATGMVTTQAYTADLNQAAQARRAAFQQNLVKLEEAIKKKEIISPEPILSDARMAEVRQEKIQEIQSLRAEMEEQGALVSEVRLEESTDDGFKLSFDYDLDTGDGLVKGTQTTNHTYSIDDVGYLKDVSLNLMPGLRSPLGIYKGDIEKVVEGAIRIEDQAASLKFLFEKKALEALDPITKGLGKKLSSVFGNQQVKKVESILQAGDSEGKLYSVSELKAGVNGVQLTDDEIEAYYNLRDVFDGLWWNDNNILKDQLVKQGFKKYIDPDQDLFIKPLEKSKVLSSTDKVYDPVQGRLLTLKSSDELTDVYQKNRTVAQVDGHYTVDGQKYTHIIVDNSKVSDIPAIVKHYRKGYTPRIREDGLYYVKVSDDTLIDGKQVKAFGAGSNVKTIRSFDTAEQAEAFADAQRKLIDRGEIRVLQDNVLNKELSLTQGISQQTGTFRGARSTEGVPHGPEGVEPVLMGPLAALSRNISFVANKMSRAEWRLARQKEWINTANRYLDVPIKSFNDPVPTTDTGKILERLRSDIRMWGRIEDTAETDLAQALQRVFEWGMNKQSSKVANSIAKAARWLKSKDPISQMRGAAFHMLLGWFNPIQLWVQAQGAAVALSLAPRLAPKALLRQTALSMVENLDSIEAIRKTAKTMKVDPDTLVGIKRLYDKSGLGRAIRANPDVVDAFEGGTSSIKSLADKGLIFYRMGEGFNRRTSFNIALDEFLKANPSKTVKNMTDADLRKVVTRTNDFMLNLNKGNAAQWQNGLISVPTQFLQVTAKAWGNMLPTLLGGSSRFTPAEKVRLLIGQATLYGVPGVPLGTAAGQYVGSLLGLKQEDIDKLDDATRASINGGIEGLFFYTIFGEELVVGPRGSLASGFSSVSELLLDRRMPIYEALAGPFGTVMKRSKAVYDKFSAITMDLTDTDTTLVAAGEAFKSLTTIVSSTKNLHKAYDMWVHGWLLDSKSNVIAQDFNLAEAITTSIGFELQRVANIRGVEDIQAKKKELKVNTGKMLRETTMSFLKIQNPTDKDIATYKNMIDVLVSNKMFSSFDQEELKNKHSTFLKNILKKDTKESRALKKMVEEYIEALPSDFLAITNSGVLQVNNNEEVEDKVFKDYQNNGEIK